MTHPKYSFRHLVEVLAWLVAGLGVLLAGGGASAMLDQFTPAAPMLLVLSMIMAVGVVMVFRFRRRRLLFGLGAAMLVTGYIATPEYFAAANRAADARATPPGREIRVLSVNLWNANADVSRTLKLIAAEKPDVIVFAEANSFIDQLNAALPEYRTRITCEQSAYCGVAIYARHPGRALAYGWDVSQGLRGMTSSTEDLRMAVAEIEIGPARIPIVAVHLHRKAAGARAGELDELARRLAVIGPPEAMILAGDFNTSGWSFAMRRFEARLPLKRTTFALPTWPSPTGWIAGLPAPALLSVDHVFIGRDWRAKSVRTGPDVGSDHYPVLSTLRTVSRTGSNPTD